MPPILGLFSESDDFLANPTWQSHFKNENTRQILAAEATPYFTGEGLTVFQVTKKWPSLASKSAIG
jgi:hypothetical protein